MAAPIPVAVAEPPAAPDDSDHPPLLSRRSRRSKWLVGAAVTAVLALGAAGIFAVSSFTGPARGGADDPSDLGSRLLSAIDDEDVLGVIDVLLPGEREALGDPFVEMVSQLQRLDVLGDTDLSQLAGFDVRLSDTAVRTRATGVDDIVDIEMSADVSVSVDGTALPIGPLLTERLPDDVLAELRGTQLTQSDRLDLTLTAVQQDGRWYFSLFHTVAEQARADLGADVAIPVAGLAPQGAPSPEAAVDELFDSVESLDLAGLIGVLDPTEAAALQRYAPLFLDRAQQELDGVPLSWAIVDRSIRVEGSGDRRTAFVDALAIEGTLDGSPLSYRFQDGCTSARLGGVEVEQCGQAATAGGLDDVFADQPEVGRLLEVIRSAFDDIEPIGLELRRRDGEWFVSPLATVDEAVLAGLRALDRDELDSIIDAGSQAVTSFGDLIFGSLGGIAPPDLPDEPLTVPLGDDDPDWFGCYDLGADEAAACFEAAVGRGDITADMVPLVLRHPECGYTDVSWAGQVYSMDDDEFLTTVAAARPCFMALVEDGSADWWELPDEVANLDCFEGRNWYQVFDDPAYDDRVEACRMAALEQYDPLG
jgi:hypothetical protein